LRLGAQGHDSRRDRATDGYVETHDKEILEELYKLARELEKMEKGDG
jgi:hypothetical protein